jgi:hypothetical protein
MNKGFLSKCELAVPQVAPRVVPNHTKIKKIMRKSSILYFALLVLTWIGVILMTLTFLGLLPINKGIYLLAPIPAFLLSFYEFRLYGASVQEPSFLFKEKVPASDVLNSLLEYKKGWKKRKWYFILAVFPAAILFLVGTAT